MLLVPSFLNQCKNRIKIRRKRALANFLIKLNYFSLISSNNTLSLKLYMLELEQFTPYISYIPLGIMGLLLLIQLYYIYFVYGKLAIHKTVSYNQDAAKPPISVIISAFNEQDNLK